MGQRTRTGNPLDWAEVRDLARKLVEDPIYLLNLQVALRNREAAPAVEVMIWAYAFGKPREEINIKSARIVKVIHEYAESIPPELRGTDSATPLELPSVKVHALPGEIRELRGSDQEWEDHAAGVEGDHVVPGESGDLGPPDEVD